MFGFYNVRKSPGPTSHNLVATLRRRLPRKTKVGHAGTLDPFAEGVLVLCVGPATRLAEFVQQQIKRYHATIRLGARSTTDDPEGKITPVDSDIPPPSEAAIRDVLGRFVGTIEQVPPAHSAVHVAGRRAYDLARKGQAPELPAREVCVSRIDLLRCEGMELEIDLTCSTGTYIRSLARDIGEALGTGGYCAALTRTAVGRFGYDDARNLDALDLRADLVTPQAGIDLRIISVEADDAAHLRNGRSISADCLGPLVPATGQCVSLVDAEDRLLAIARLDPEGARLKPEKVFHGE